MNKQSQARDLAIMLSLPTPENIHNMSSKQYLIRLLIVIQIADLEMRYIVKVKRSKLTHSKLNLPEIPKLQSL